MEAFFQSDCILGCLLGGALGDALAAPFENCVVGTAFEVQSFLRITDDTQLTLATCEAIIAAGRADPAAIAARFATWHCGRRITGLGSSTLKSLTELAAGGHWALVGATGERSAGNGAAIRVAPLAFLLNPDDLADRRTLRDVCRITHHNDESYVGALAMLLALQKIACDQPRVDDFMSQLAEALPDSRMRDRFVQIAEDSPTVLEYATRFGATGYVVDSVPLAILAATQAVEFLPMIQQIVACGGDVDSIGAMAGQLHGARHGTASLPRELLTRINEAHAMQVVFEDFASTFQV
ncbi:ADP-ribosylglycohydrolase family protein [Planctellipticum variicoloris]|uniref:ADP-ribosylglycohydrolase family protein n=1 Tax=Planctellipticum variicoloris TaxID=3064265 RepID=UPI003013D314|nr:ADP-ribosylglycohydrolase family protein [Planctomycetaceae bacterium SH412]